MEVWHASRRGLLKTLAALARKKAAKQCLIPPSPLIGLRAIEEETRLVKEYGVPG